MFYMTSEILIETKDGHTAKVKPIDVKWKVDAGSYCDSCTITLPLYPYLKTEVEGTDIISGESRCIFAVDGKVTVKLGYDGNNVERFVGFISSIDYDSTLTIKCEGYYHLLKNKTFTSSWAAISLISLLRYITKETDITLSPDIINIPLGPLTFSNVKTSQIFDKMKSDYALCVFFRGRELYVGPYAYGKRGDTVKLRIGWNVKSSGLKVQDPKDDIEVNLVVKSADGNIQNTSSSTKKAEGVENVKISEGMPTEFKKAVIDRVLSDKNTGGRLGGSVTCFLQPVFHIGDVADIEDVRYPEKRGRFFVTAISGGFGKNGGTQQLTLKNYGNR